MTHSHDIVLPGDLGFFVKLACAESLSAAARELGLSPAAVSKHLAQMEKRVGVPLLNRTTRRMTLTPEGQIYLEQARKILDNIDALTHMLGAARTAPQGLLRVNATLGFGRTRIAPLVSRFIQAYPKVEVQLQLTASPPPSDDVYDVSIRFGEPPDARLIARRLATNRRLLCASPSYLEKHGAPLSANDLGRHNCITVRQDDEPYGVWKLSCGRGTNRRVESVRTNGNLTTNDSEAAVRWALEGHGILMRAEWHIAPYLIDGRLVPILPDCETPNADIFALYPPRHQLTNRVRAFVDFLAADFQSA